MSGPVSPALLFSRVYNKVIQTLKINGTNRCANGCTEKSKGKLVAVRADLFKPPPSVVVGTPSEKAQTAVDLAFSSGESASFVKRLAKFVSGSGDNSYNISLYSDAVDIVPSTSISRPKASIQALKTFVVETIASNPSIAASSLDLCEKIVFEASQTRMRSSILFSTSEIQNMVRRVVGKSYHVDMDLPTMMKSLTINSTGMGGEGIGDPVGHVSQFPDFKPVFLEPLAVRIWNGTSLTLKTKPDSYVYTFSLDKAAYLQLVTSSMVSACRGKTWNRFNARWFEPQPGDASEIVYPTDILVLQKAPVSSDLFVRFVHKYPSEYGGQDVGWRPWKSVRNGNMVWNFPPFEGFDVLKPLIEEYLRHMGPPPEEEHNTYFNFEMSKVIANHFSVQIRAHETVSVGFLDHSTVMSIVSISFLASWTGYGPRDKDFTRSISRIVRLLQKVLNGEEENHRAGLDASFVDGARNLLLEDVYSFGDILRKTWALYQTIHPHDGTQFLVITQEMQEEAGRYVQALLNPPASQ